jgi:predicted DCC family thiol-disulfide oxidoreductase YuxK
VNTLTAPGPVLLFDGVCNLCNGAVRFVAERDPRGVFRFASLQSEAGQALLRQHGLRAGDFDSVVLVDGARVLTKSAAALAVAARLSGGWPALSAFRFVPRPLRDAVYDLVARHRYRVFGRTDECMIPTPELRGRFLDGG